MDSFSKGNRPHKEIKNLLYLFHLRSKELKIRKTI